MKLLPNEGFQFAGWEGDGIIDVFSAQTQIYVGPICVLKAIKCFRIWLKNLMDGIVHGLELLEFEPVDLYIGIGVDSYPKSSDD